MRRSGFDRAVTRLGIASALVAMLLPSPVLADVLVEAAPSDGTVTDSPPPAAPARPVIPGLRDEVLNAAWSTHACARERGTLASAAFPDRIAVIDYTLPSTDRRLWVIDVASGEVLLHEWVAHGQGTGDDLARTFSNVEGSHQSSLGVFRTGETYIGQHGRSLRLDGLEPGVNDRARDRAIVIHGADYVSDDFIARNGRLGRSWGCPAVRNDVVDPLVDAIAGGSLLLAWYEDESWLHQSTWLSCSPS